MRARLSAAFGSALTTATRRRGAWVTIALWAIVGVAAVALAPSVYNAESNNPSSSLPPGAQSVQVSRLSQQFPGGGFQDAVVVYRRAGGLTAADLATIEGDRHRLDMHRAPGQRDALPAQLAPDHTTALVQVPLATDHAQKLNAVDRIRGVVGEGSGGLDVKVTGQAAFSVDSSRAFSGLDSTLLVAAAAIVALLLLLIYRSPFLWLVPLVCVGLADFAAQALVLGLTKAGLVIDSQTLGIMTVLVFGVGTDYALLIVSRYREELHQHADHHQAAAAALRGAAPAVIASAATVSISLLFLLTSELRSDQSMGPVAAVGVAVAMIVMLTALPAILVASGRRIFWPYIPRHDEAEPEWQALADEAVAEVEQEVAIDPQHANEPPAHESRHPASRRTHLGDLHLPHPRLRELPSHVHLAIPSLHGVRRDNVWVKLGRAILLHPRRVWMAAASALAVLCVGLLAFHINLPISATFRGEVDSASGQQLLSKAFPAGITTPLVVMVHPASQAQRAVSVTSATPGIVSTGPVTVVQDLARFEAVESAESASSRSNATVHLLRERLGTSVGPGALVGGEPAISADTQAASTHDLLLMIPLVLVVVFVILVALLRAAVAPLMLMATVLISFGAALGVSSVVFGSAVFRFPGTSPALPLFAFIFLVALGCDYNIFLMARVREEARALGSRIGVVRGLSATGGVITSAGIVLAGTFLILDILPVTLLAEIGFVVAFGVLLDTFLVRTVLVPAIAVDLGHWLWWPSSLWRGERPIPPAESSGTSPQDGDPAPPSPRCSEAEGTARFGTERGSASYRSS